MSTRRKRQDQHENDGQPAQPAQANDTPALEWVMGAIGLLLVSAAIGFMLYKALAGDAGPPEIGVQVESVTPTKDAYLLRFRAINRGGSAAKGVVVRAELMQSGKAVETSETTLDYLPSKSERQGGLFFGSDPRQLEIRLRALGYEKP